MHSMLAGEVAVAALIAHRHQPVCKSKLRRPEGGINYSGLAGFRIAEGTRAGAGVTGTGVAGA